MLTPGVILTAVEIQANSAQKALAGAGLMDAFVAIARFEGEATRTVRKDGLVVVADDNIASRMIKKRGENQRKISVRGHPEINRTTLRALLLSRLPRERVAPLSPLLLSLRARAEVLSGQSTLRARRRRSSTLYPAPTAPRAALVRS